MVNLFVVVLCVLVMKTYCAPGDKAKKYCQKYGEAVYTIEDSPVLSRKASKNKVADCGIVSVPLIIGGVQAKEKEFPHMALIGFGQSPDSRLHWHCGGALISDSYILTAAHCVTSREYGDAQQIQMGDTIVDGLDTIRRNIIERIEHPDYKRPKKYNDIALFKLDEPVEFSGYVRPACLNVQPEISEKRAMATGFGKLAYSDSDGSKELMKVELDIIPNSECNNFYSDEPIQIPEGVTSDILCAGELAGGKDTCQGDSGGPLQTVLKEPYCMYNLIGVTSFGKFCGYAQSPGLYMRVSSYIDWIEKIVWP